MYIYIYIHTCIYIYTYMYDVVAERIGGGTNTPASRYICE